MLEQLEAKDTIYLSCSGCNVSITTSFITSSSLLNQIPHSAVFTTSLKRMKLITSQVLTGTDWAAWQTSCSGLHLIPVNFYDPPLTPNITLKVRPKGDIKKNKE